MPNKVVEEYLDRLGEKNKTVVLADRQPGKDEIDILQIVPQPTRHIDAPSQEHPPVAPTVIPPIREITQADIDAALQKWNGNSESKQAVVSYMGDHGRERDTAAWLAKEYGTDFSHPLRVVVTGVDDEVVLPWPKVQRRIAQLIREDKFFTQQEKTVLEHNQEYRLLDRLRSDCEYFLGVGNRAEKHLWTGSVRAQIAKMRELYDTLPEKPEWLTKEVIDDYAERMAPPYLVVAYHHFENGFDDKLDYQTLAEAEKAAQGYVDGTMEYDGFQYDGAAIYNQQTRKYLRVYGNYPDERAHAEAAGRDWVEKSAASTESDIAPAGRFHVVSLDQGFYTRYAIWDDEADGYYVDADGVAEEFTSEWQAEEYRLKLQEQVLMERAKGLISDFCQSEYGAEPDFSDPAKIGIAYTTITDDEIPIQVNIDLVKFRLERDLNDEHLETRQYSSLQDLIANELEILDFSDLVHVSDEDIEQYRWHNREEATEKALETVESVSLPQENKALYSVGDTVYLDNEPFEITEVGLFDVHLRDPSQAYPVFRAESKERLEVLLRQDERNAHLFAMKPPAISEEEKLILEHEGQAALSEMGELIPDPDDAISQAEPDEPPAHSPAVSILIDGQWQEFPSASAAEKASYADLKAASHRNAQNFRITDDDLGAGGAKAKFQANLNAIQLLKHLEAEGLQASPEQQQVLSRYVGWGGLPDAFDASKPSWASEYQALKCILQVMEPICEAKFYERSNGFRPNRSAENAIAQCYKMINLQKLYFVVDVDIKGFFDNVNHTKLIQQIWHMGIRDKKLLCIIREMLKAPIIMPDGTVEHPVKGTPQGGILSPLLSNIVLNELDWWIASQWENMPTKYEYSCEVRPNGTINKTAIYGAFKNTTKLKEVHIVRYADDFKLFCRKRSDAEKVFIAVKLWLQDRLKLEISEEKSKIVNLKRHYSEFLGFEIKAVKKRKRYVVKSHMTEKAISKEKAALIEQVKQIAHVQDRDDEAREITLYNSMVFGIHNYYRYATMIATDCEQIHRTVSTVMKSRLYGRLTKKGQINEVYIRKNYGDSKQIRFISSKTVAPVGYIQTKTPLFKKKKVCKYTPEGRAEIHKNLGINTSIMLALMRIKEPRRSVEYMDNRISLYAAQYGRCAVTGKELWLDEIHCHHKQPLCRGGTDKYMNLVIVHRDIHRLIHATDPNTIVVYLNLFQLDKKALAKLNALRVLAGQPEI